jgi:hypothetical protein
VVAALAPRLLQAVEPGQEAGAAGHLAGEADHPSAGLRYSDRPTVVWNGEDGPAVKSLQLRLAGEVEVRLVVPVVTDPPNCVVSSAVTITGPAGSNRSAARGGRFDIH